MSLLQRIIEELLTTKQDAYLLFCDVYDDLTTLQKKTLREEFQKEFNTLYIQYIRPKAQEEYDRFFPRYQKHVDDVPYKIEAKRKALQNSKAVLTEQEITDQWIAGSIWLDRRKQEVTKIKSTLAQFHSNTSQSIKKDRLKPLYKTIVTDLKYRELQELYHFLSKGKDPFITNCDEATFLTVFSAKENTTIPYQPNIHWKKGIALFHYFFYFLHYTNCIDLGSDKEAVSTRLYKGQFFVNAKNPTKVKPFAEISKANTETRKKREDNVMDFMFGNVCESKDFKEMEDLKDLGHFFKKWRG